MVNIKAPGRPMHRTHSMKKRAIHTPGGKTIIHLKPKMHSKHECGICHNQLHGKPTGRPVIIQKLNKNKRTIDRPFGGNLCSKCSRQIIGLRTKLKYGKLSETDIPISLVKYVCEVK